MSMLDNVYNYYERLVLEEMSACNADENFDQELLIDAVCVALNKLPGRYFRHGVDMAFYLSKDEYLAMKENVTQAVSTALAHVDKNKRSQ